MMITHDIQQGSEEWLALRANYYCASEAAAMLGLSDNMSRNELICMKAGGAEKEYSDWVKKNLFEKGHQVEAAARLIIEKMIDEDLFPATGTCEVERLCLLASFDGITMDGRLIFENKLTNRELAPLVAAGELPDTHWPQLEHQLLVSGAEQAVFSVSDGTETGTTWCYYESRAERRARLIAGWKQFAEDQQHYQPPEIIHLSPVVKSIDDLPVLAIDIFGEVRSTNIALFKQSALDFIESINTDLRKDEDFAQAESVIKFCSEAEKRLELAKQQALSQTTSIDQLFRAIDSIKEEMRQKRLALEKLVVAKKESIRFHLIQAAKDKLASHVAALNGRLGKALMPSIEANFTGAIKSKKTIDSLNNAVDTCLANAKTQATMMADRIWVNLNTLDELGKDFPGLFADLVHIAAKENDDFTALVKSRIADHKEAEAKRQAAQQAKAQETVPLASPAMTPAVSQPKAVTPPATKEPDLSVVYAFLKTRDFGKDNNRIRAALIEFVRFQEASKDQEAA